MAVFNPRYPSTENSLNRLRLVVADGHLLAEATHGKTGYELASTHALVQLIQAHASTSGIAIPDTTTEQLTWFYEQAAAGTAFFVEIAEIIGMRLGCLLLTLLRNDSQTHATNADKDSAYWAYWSAMRTVYLGGGLVAGRMGSVVAAQAQALVRQQAKVSDYTVTAADYPQHLPLLGAARTVLHGN
ncbi:MAG: hypothetical protein K8L99_08170, partial [Anaerolineae bacterium]|nr:hypothetical protein [Anaerolineae bacterium]